MSEKSPGLGRRLLRIPGQLLLTLVNTTALLIIVASVLLLIALNRVDEIGARLAGSVTGASLARLQMTPGEFKERVEGLDVQIQQLSLRLQDADVLSNGQYRQDIQALNDNLKGLRQAAEGIRDAGPDIAAAAFDEAGQLLSDSLYIMRGCAAKTEVEISLLSRSTPPVRQ